MPFWRTREKTMAAIFIALYFFGINFTFYIHLKDVVLNGGDAGIHLFGYLDYVLHGKGWMHTGANYPYGENIVFTDNLPWLSALLRGIHQHIIPLRPYLLSIHNLWVLIQMPLASFLMFLLLKRFKVPFWLNLICAMAIIQLCPHIYRLPSHVSLGTISIYIAFFILIFDALHTDKKGLPFIVFLLTVLALFTHLYFIFGVGLLLFFLTVILFIFKRSDLKKLWKITIPFGVATVIGYTLILLNDPFPNRAQFIWGLFEYSGSLNGTFIPQYGFISEKVYKIFGGLPKVDFEAQNFLGYIAILCNLLFMYLYFRSKEFRTKEVKFSFYIWLAAFLCWLFSLEVFYLPFKKETILETPLINQFRSIGRLGILWYFATAIAAVQVLSYARKIRSQYKKIWVPLFTLLWFTESFLFAYPLLFTDYITVGQQAFNAKEKIPLDKLLAKHHMKISDFQCSLIIPLYTGCSKVASDGSGGYGLTYIGGRIRLEYGLPTMGVSFTRTDEWQGFNLFQMVSTYPLPKTRLNDMDERPVLLICLDNDYLKTREIRNLLNKSEYLGDIEGVFFYKTGRQVWNDLIIPFSEEETGLRSRGRVQVKKTKEKEKLFSWVHLDKDVLPVADTFICEYKADLSPGLPNNLDYSFVLKNGTGEILREYKRNRYLSFNFDSLYSVERIPFSLKDLQDIKYLEITTNQEKARVKDVYIYPKPSGPYPSPYFSNIIP